MRRRLPETLARYAREIEGYAREYGLDFVPICFELLDHDQLNEVASYGGFPTRYPHWKWGMDYEQLQKSYVYGLSKIYELVINNDPCYAYLMKSNSLVDQKLVMAHVCGHADFFKHNLWFAHTNRKMMDQMANHGTRMRRYAERHGHEEVERFIDACLSIENLIDIHSPFVKRRAARKKQEDGEEPTRPTPYKLRSKDYMDRYVNPPEFLEEQQRRMDEAVEKSKRFPEQPERDIMLFLLQHAPLERWQKDILGMLREEAYYFAPQAMTKIMNEGWACVAAETPVFTDAGLIPMARVVAGDCGAVGDGQEARAVLDRNVIEGHPTIALTTGRGLVLEGSTNHRVLLADGVTWKQLDELKPGEALKVAGGGEVWPSEEVELAAVQVAQRDLDRAASLAGREATTATATIRLPAQLTAGLGELVGTLIGRGRVDRFTQRVVFRAEDLAQRNAFVRRWQEVFGRAPISDQADELEFDAPEAGFLSQCVGLADVHKVRDRQVPDSILRSPRHVVCAFLRGYFDCDGWAGQQGVFLSTASESISRSVQLLLLNLGILSRRGMQSEGTWHLHVSGASAARFAEVVGFDLARKRAALDEYLRRAEPLKPERWEDVVESIDPGQATVYDITVEETHRYAAAGLINHNSFWHSKLMTQKILTDPEVIDYADHHAGTMGTRPGVLNPYKVGIELFRDIEDRWNKGKFGAEWEECDDAEKRRNWDKQLGLGREKVFEVRKIYNDVLFIDEFLTEDFAREQKMFTYEYSKQSGDYVIASREFKKVKQKLLDSLTNWGNPVIAIENGNYDNRGELYLVHRHDGQDLQMDQAKDTLENVQMLWGRPVHLETQVEKRKKVLSYDGKTHSERTL